MKITVRGESVKMDAEARELIIEALNEAAKMWLNQAANQKEQDVKDIALAQVGEAKALAKLLEPKAEDGE